MKKLLTLTLLALSLSSNALAEGVAYDPYEGYNRFMFGVNDRIDRHVLSPAARGYRAVTPKPVRSGIGNFFNNLRDIVSVGSNLLRLDISKAGTDLVRVGINTTFGFGGLIDIAGEAQMPNNKNTLGDTFASWGWKNSNYFVYPLLGPSTVRDAVGNTITSAYSPESALFGNGSGYWAATGVKVLDTRASLLDLTDSVEQAALDRYAFVRDAYMAARAKQTGTTLPGSQDDYVPSFEEGGNNADNAPAADTSSTAQTVSTPAPTAGNLPATPAAEAAAEAAAPANNTGSPLPPNTIRVETERP
ncbi:MULTISPECIES: VacJ family lipoprotein [Eikenella]|uniref:ABC transporter n=1 Tax=Eikenella longinqua TaxID=1795827 RepID=A0A1A9RTX8_9NEIS|nr:MULTISPECIES: VacJ family lipoprotein [Eikenella]OAM26365.1 ABC transporter [Eikenella longinqua]